MTVRGIKVISDTDAQALERKVAEFIARNPVDDLQFSTADTQNGVLYSVMLLLMSQDYFAQV